VADRSRPVHLHFEVDRGRYLRPIDWHPFADGVDYLHGVGTRLPSNTKGDRARIIVPARNLFILDAVDDARDLLQLDWRAIAPGDDHILVFLGPPHRGGRE